MRRGFTLLELLVVMALLGVLLILGSEGYRRVQANAQLQQDAGALAQAFQYARSEAKKTHNPQCVRVYPQGYSRGPTCQGSLQPFTYAVASGLGGGSLPQDVVFYPPYGTTDAPLRGFVLTRAGFPDLSRKVNVVGILGKVVVQ